MLRRRVDVEALCRLGECLSISRRRCLSLAASLTVGSCAPRRKPWVTSGERVVSLSPSTSEMMFTLGVGDLLVGRTNACNVPPEVKRAVVVGGFGPPNIEVLLSLRPTVVVGSRGPSGPQLATKLAQHGVEVLLPPTRTFEEVCAALYVLGERFAAQTRAQEAVTQMRLRTDEVSSWASRRDKLSALVVFDNNPNYVAGPGGFVDELLQLAGARNVIETGGPYPVVDIERLLLLDPDVIIDAMSLGEPDISDSRLLRAPGWTLLRAVGAGAVRRLPSDAALRPGPRLAQGLAELAEAVHGAAPS